MQPSPSKASGSPSSSEAMPLGAGTTTMDLIRAEYCSSLRDAQRSRAGSLPDNFLPVPMEFEAHARVRVQKVTRLWSDSTDFGESHDEGSVTSSSRCQYTNSNSKNIRRTAQARKDPTEGVKVSHAQFRTAWRFGTKIHRRCPGWVSGLNLAW
jgi:hypothetical protein